LSNWVNSLSFNNQQKLFLAVATVLVGATGARLLYKKLQEMQQEDESVSGTLSVNDATVTKEKQEQEYVESLGLSGMNVYKDLQIILDKFSSEQDDKNKKMLKDLFDENYAKLRSKEETQKPDVFWEHLSWGIAQMDNSEESLLSKQSKYLSAIKENIDRFKNNESLQIASLNASILAGKEKIKQLEQFEEEEVRKRSMEKQPERLSDEDVQFILGGQEAGGQSQTEEEFKKSSTVRKPEMFTEEQLQESQSSSKEIGGQPQTEEEYIASLELADEKQPIRRLKIILDNLLKENQSLEHKGTLVGLFGNNFQEYLSIAKSDIDTESFWTTFAAGLYPSIKMSPEKYAQQLKYLNAIRDEVGLYRGNKALAKMIIELQKRFDFYSAKEKRVEEVK
jgi:hypothetical protein